MSKKIERHSFILGAIGSAVSGITLMVATTNGYGSFMVNFFGRGVGLSGFLYRTWLIYLPVLAIGLIFADLGHRRFSKIYENKPSYSFIYTTLTSILLIVSTGLIAQENQTSNIGGLDNYWNRFLFEDFNLGIAFGVLTLTIFALLGLIQLMWGRRYLHSYQNARNQKLTQMNGLLHTMSGIILLFTISPVYLLVLQFLFFISLLFLGTQIISSLTFLTLRKNKT